MNDVEIASEAPISEALKNKEAANTNNLIDEKDADQTRLDALEGLVPNFVSSDLTNFSGTSHSGLVAGSSTALTGVAVGSIVEIIVEGQVGAVASRFDATTTGVLTLQRNAATIASRSFGTSHSQLNIRFTDTAPVTGTNTYTLIWTVGVTASVIITTSRMVAIEVRH